MLRRCCSKSNIRYETSILWHRSRSKSVVSSSALNLDRQENDVRNPANLKNQAANIRHDSKFRFASAISMSMPFRRLHPTSFVYAIASSIRSVNTSSITSPITSSITSINTSPAREPVASHVFGGNLHCVPRVIKDSPVDDSTLSATILVEAKLDDERRMVSMSWNDGEVTDYPYVWLRDCCQCEQCFDEGPCSRRLLVHEVDYDAKPVHMQVDGTSQEMELIWSDGHRGVYRYKWLLARSFTPEKQDMRAKWNGRKNKKLWDASFIENIPTLSFNEVLNNKKAQYDWITLLEEVGFVLLKGAPLEAGQLQRIGSAIGFIRKTNYGETSKIQFKPNPSNLAYTTGPLMLHTDLAHYDYLPGMQMMHCIEQASGEGGKSLFVDGFLAAKQLREQNPAQFKLLTDTIFDFYDIGSDFLDFHQMSRHPTIKLDDEGNLQKIVFSTHIRDSFLRVPLESVEPVYQALISFTQLLYDQRNLVPFKMQPGDITCFDNWRVLHGRIGYDMKAGDSRFLEHGYIDWDEMHSRRRVLKTLLQIPDEEY